MSFVMVILWGPSYSMCFLMSVSWIATQGKQDHYSLEINRNLIKNQVLISYKYDQKSKY